MSSSAVSNPKMIAGISVLVRDGTGLNMRLSKTKVSAGDIKRLYDEFKDECEYIYENIISKTTKITGPMVAAAISAVHCGVSPESVQRFFLLLLKDDATGCEKYNMNACLNWKRQLSEARVAHIRMDQGKALKGTENAIYHFVNNTKVSRIVIPKDYKYDISQKVCNALTRKG